MLTETVPSRMVYLADSREVAITEFGDPAGTSVLALHGAPDSRLIFSAAHVAACRRGLRLICPDRPGYGRSAPDSGPTLERRAVALQRLADELGLDRFAILGVSGGSPYAVALAARMGGRCSVLGLVSPIGPVVEMIDLQGGAMSPGFRRFFIDLQRWPWLLRLCCQSSARVFRLAPELWMRSTAVRMSKPDRAILARPEVRRLLVASLREAVRQGVDAGLCDLAIFARPWNVDYTAITASTLLWQGLEDYIVPPPATAFLAARIPDARLHAIAGAGHFWVLDHVDDVLAELAGAIARSC